MLTQSNNDYHSLPAPQKVIEICGGSGLVAIVTKEFAPFGKLTAINDTFYVDDHKNVYSNKSALDLFGNDLGTISTYLHLTPAVGLNDYVKASVGSESWQLHLARHYNLT